MKEGTAMLTRITAGGNGEARRAVEDVAAKAGIAHERGAPGHVVTDIRAGSSGSAAGAARRKEEIDHIHDTDGTLLITIGGVNERARSMTERAKNEEIPLLHMDLDELSVFQAAVKILDWLKKNRISSLHVVCEKAHDKEGVYREVLDILETVLYLGMNDIDIPYHITFLDARRRLKQNNLPGRVEDVVDLLVSDFSLREKVMVARMDASDLQRLCEEAGTYINTEFRIWQGNDALLEECRARAGGDLSYEDPPRIIIRAMWEKLRGTHVTRAVKQPRGEAPGSGNG